MLEKTECCGCGMQVNDGEYHPYGVCLMYRGCGDANVVRANLAAMIPAWLSVDEHETPLGQPFDGYNAGWIDEDFNHLGIRECVRNDHEPFFESAWWNNDMDNWQSAHEKPTHWKARVEVIT
jgi:hypothetical protein